MEDASTSTSDLVEWTKIPPGSLCDVYAGVNSPPMRLVVWPDGNAAWSPTTAPVFRPTAFSKRQGRARVLTAGLTHDQCSLIAERSTDEQVALARLHRKVRGMTPLIDVRPRTLVVRCSPGPGPLTAVDGATPPPEWQAAQVVGVLADEVSDGEAAALNACASLKQFVDVVAAIQLPPKLGDVVPSCRVPKNTYVRTVSGDDLVAVADDRAVTKRAVGGAGEPRFQQLSVRGAPLVAFLPSGKLQVLANIDSHQHDLLVIYAGADHGMFMRRRIAEGLYKPLAKHVEVGVFVTPSGRIVSFIDNVITPTDVDSSVMVRRLLAGNHGLSTTDLSAVKSLGQLDDLMRRHHRVSGKWSQVGTSYVAARFADSVRIWTVDFGAYSQLYGAVYNAAVRFSTLDIPADLARVGFHAWPRLGRWAGGYRDEDGSYRSAPSATDLLYSYVERPPSVESILLGLKGGPGLHEYADADIACLYVAPYPLPQQVPATRQVSLQRLDVDVSRVDPGAEVVKGPIVFELPNDCTAEHTVLVAWKYAGSDEEAAAFAAECAVKDREKISNAVRVVVVDLSRTVPVEMNW